MRIHPSQIVLGVALVVVLRTPAASQPVADTIPRDARVRLWTAGASMPRRMIGVADSLRGDTVFVSGIRDQRVSDHQVKVPLASVERLEVSGGRRPAGSRASRGALWGLAAYAVFVSAYVIHERATCDGPDCFGEGEAWIGLAGGLPWAAGVGAGIGLAIPMERWRQIHLPLR